MKDEYFRHNRGIHTKLLCILFAKITVFLTPEFLFFKCFENVIIDLKISNYKPKICLESRKSRKKEKKSFVLPAFLSSLQVVPKAT